MVVDAIAQRDRVGHVDQASDAQGRMQVEDLGLGLQRLLFPYQLITGVNDREAMVALANEDRDAGRGKAGSQ